MERFFVETFGCTANASASELMAYLLQECGHERVSSIEMADFVLVNTCIVKAPTESKIKSLLKKLAQKYPLIIAGCMPQVLSDWCHENIPKAALLGVDHFGEVCTAADNLIAGLHYELISRDKVFCEEIHRDRNWKQTAIIEISKGCSGQCAYCIVKIAKGPLVSKSKEQIILEAKTALAEGCKEIWLTAQDTASYGIDLNKKLPELLTEIIALPEDFMIRIGMMNADQAIPIANDLKRLLQHPKVYSFLHLPLQSGSNHVLTKMKRKYSVEEFISLVEDLRTIGKLTLSTDVITGFPGETKDDSIQTREIMKTIKFDIVNISKYGDRQGTLASKSREKLPTEIVKERSRELTIIQKEISYERNKEWVDWEGDALALRIDDRSGSILLRNKAYKIIAVKNEDVELGKVYRVKIIDALKTRLLAKIVH
ncbi:MAG: tRNA (N(6)-L-threonylcarbamoyladenosine(37)-C(2))-methylthiotransferase [Candidatus Heimdallarchaeota archaeon]